MKPKIAITCSYAPKRLKRAEFPDFELEYIKSDYINKIYECGAIPYVLPNLDGFSMIDLDKSIECFDGIVFSGGVDVAPSYYSDETVHEKDTISERRDSFEVRLCRYAIEKTTLPILGICRGMQLINIVTGGTLWQDIELFRKDTKPATEIEHRRLKNSEGIFQSSTHKVKVKTISRLRKAAKSGDLTVNSSHHQFVKNLGKDVVATAFAEDGAIEALELQSDRFVVGVQWHPESLELEHSNHLISCFVSICANEKKR
jgi:putative glutamine amidotransferase